MFQSVAMCVMCPYRAGPLVPKTPSSALYLELLDASGAPTWMARDVQQLVQLAQSKQQVQVHQPGSTQTGEGQQQQQASGSGSDAESVDGDGVLSGDEGANQPEQSHNDDVDVDTLLAMAAAEVGQHGTGHGDSLTALNIRQSHIVKVVSAHQLTMSSPCFLMLQPLPTCLEQCVSSLPCTPPRAGCVVSGLNQKRLLTCYMQTHKASNPDRTCC